MRKTKMNKYSNTSYTADICYDELILKGFRFSLTEESYIYRFVIKKWNRYPVLFGIIKINEFTGKITVDVVRENGEFFAPFYADRYGRYDTKFLNAINKRIDSEFNKLGININNIN